MQRTQRLTLPAYETEPWIAVEKPRGRHLDWHAGHLEARIAEVRTAQDAPDR